MAISANSADKLTLLTLLLISCLLYTNTLHAGFTFDDNFAVITNGDVADSSKSLWLIFTDDFWGQEIKSEQSHKSYRPLTVLSFRFQRALGSALLKGRPQTKLASDHDNTRGLDPLPFHAANIILNAAVTLLVYKDQERPISSTTQQLTWVHWREASLAALLFAVHPIHTEAVAGVVGQAELLCAALSILALMAYIAATYQAQGHWRLMLLAVALVWAASLAKEIGVTIVGAMLLFDALLVPSEKPPASEGGSVLAHTRALMRSRKAARVVVMGACVLLYVKLRAWIAVSHLVSIYRKVENPIPFAESLLTRIMSTGYLHARYAGLLLAPVQLSADWSYACIPLVERLSDPRNAATLTLYAALIWVAAAAAPWQRASEALGLRGTIPSSSKDNNDERRCWEGSAVEGDIIGTAPSMNGGHEGGVEASASKDGVHVNLWFLRRARWRLVVCYGLMVGPFFPASNVLFYVGTFIGERLLYLPSIGYCMLAADFVLQMAGEWPLRGTSTPYAGEGAGGKQQTEERAQAAACCLEKRHKVAGAFVAALLLASGVRTHLRNWDWENEEILFRAAQQVCWDSAKVQLNSGILERRYQNWDRALMHFEHARAVEPGYCEPDYWIGITLLAQQTNTSRPLLELERAIHCKYVAVDAVQALAQVYQQLLKMHPHDYHIPQRWANTLISAPLNRTEDGCEVLETAANSVNMQGLLQPCLDALSPFAKGTPQADMLSCIMSRDKLRRALSKHNPDSTAAKQAAYAYIGAKGAKCRSRPSISGPVHSAGHLGLVHRMQQADADDPWLQHEWAEVLVASRRGSEAALHFEAAGVILQNWLAAGQPGDTRVGLDPFTGRAETLSRPLVAFAALKAIERIPEVGSADLCRSLLAVAGARQRLAKIVAYEAPEERFGGNFDAASLAKAAEHATDLLRRQPQCLGPNF